MALSSKLLAAVQATKARLGDLVIGVTLVQKASPTYNVTSARKSHTSNRFVLDAVLDKFNFKEIDGSIVQASDVKLLVFVTDMIPQIQDRIIIGEIEYNVIGKEPVQAGGQVLVHILQLRI